MFSPETRMYIKGLPTTCINSMEMMTSSMRVANPSPVNLSMVAVARRENLGLLCIHEGRVNSLASYPGAVRGYHFPIELFVKFLFIK